MIEPTRIFLVRHGETAWNVEQRIQGHQDIALNDTGRWQAERLGLALAGEELAAIYSSDLLRAADTAAPLAQRLGLPVQRDSGLRERAFGRLEGLTFAEIEARFPDDARRWRQREPHFGPGGGESLVNFSARCVAALTRLAAPHAVVAHGGVLDCLYRHANGVTLDAPRGWQLGNAAVNRLLYTGDGFVVVGWNDGSHLERGASDDGSVK
jgi:2,3-bisphosphoglycerate-dependent phosphoglycerate mutase